MRKLLPLVTTILLIFASFGAAEATDIEDTLNSIARYAEEYEVGNINYLQLNVYSSKIRADINAMLGGGLGPDEWGKIPVENIESVFGTPTEYTNWVWIENQHRDIRIDDPMPRWEKVIFDGRKVQIRFNAFPHFIEGENGEFFKYYAVDIHVKFKSSTSIDVEQVLSEINLLIEEYVTSGLVSAGEELLRKTMEYERLFRRQIESNMEQCVEIMGSFFTPEEKWPEQKMVQWEFPLYAGDDFEIKTHIDMCEECEWHHVNIDFRLDSRDMRMFDLMQHAKRGFSEDDRKRYKEMSIDELNIELERAVSDVEKAGEEFGRTKSPEAIEKFFTNQMRTQEMNWILNEKYNDIHNFDESILNMIERGEIEGPGGCSTLSSCKRYCDNRKNNQECRDFTYELRKESLEKIFEGYKIDSTIVAQTEWEKRLYENLEVHQDSWCRHVNDLQCEDNEGCVDGNCVNALGGNEICDNGIDDDGENVVDCQDPDCWEERHCGKLCEDVCNSEGGCWKTTHELCSGSCNDCWDCYGSGRSDDECRQICERECNPCHNQPAIQNACDDCWSCEDEAYGGCYSDCRTCQDCNDKRMSILNGIFERAARGEVQTPGGCMSEDECHDYCRNTQEEGCWETLKQIGIQSDELDCSDDCKECTICNYDEGNFKCDGMNQHFDRNNGYCVCDEGFHDCDGEWNNGCEADNPCGEDKCSGECKDCDVCWEEMEGSGCGDNFEGCLLECIRNSPPECVGCSKVCGAGCEEGRSNCESGCGDICIDCQKCRNPDMPTYICDGVEQLEPCDEIEYVCNGVKQKKPCTLYVCDGVESTIPCDEINETNVLCGEHQILENGECVCKEGFRDCDSDGKCESTKSCGLEICDDLEDNDGNNLIDCQDANCDGQICGFDGDDELVCIEKKCVSEEEVVPPEQNEPVCGNHICEDGENKENCHDDCVVCDVYDPPECPNGKIVWSGKDEFGCHLAPICVVTEKTCEVDEDCPQEGCGVSQCVEGECRIIELALECEKVCLEGEIQYDECNDGTEIVISVCSANRWVGTGNNCPEPVVTPETEPEEPEPSAPEPEDEEIEPEPEDEEIEPEPEEPETEPEEPEIEEEPVVEVAECTLAGDCGGPQDVCSNGKCVTLPIKVEEATPEPEEPEPSAPEPESIPEPEPEPEPPAPEPEPEPPAPEPESIPEPEPEPPATEPAPEPPPEEPITGNIVTGLTDFLTGLFTGDDNRPCVHECEPCEKCNRGIDEVMKKIENGEVSGPNGCKNRRECDDYCYRWENEEECMSFYNSQGVSTFRCWDEICKPCEICRYDAGEHTCNANQYFDRELGHCECNEGWQDCDGDWNNGCEKQGECKGCESKDDCAQDRCAEWGNVIMQFDCFKGEEWTNDKGAAIFRGSCRSFPNGRKEGWIHFDMHGEPFGELDKIRESLKMEMGKEWCDWEYESRLNERLELQKSLTPGFLRWFFEDYVPSAPDEWEKHIGGIFDSYWRLVDNSRMMSETMGCIGTNEFPDEYELIDISYDTEFGSVHIWETETTTNFFGNPTSIISPYMQIWVFPTKEFIKKEFSDGMKDGLMPGPDGEQNPELSPSEIEKMKNNEDFMRMISHFTDKYGDEAKLVFSIMDGEEVVFNALITVNDDILLKMEPMETYDGEYDAKMIMEFDFFYEMILSSEKDMRGGHVEYPPWESRPVIGDMFKGMVDGMKMWFMIQGGISSGQIRAEPGDALQDGLMLMQFIFERGDKGPEGEGEGQGPQEGEEGQGPGSLFGPPPEGEESKPPEDGKGFGEGEGSGFGPGPMEPFKDDKGTGDVMGLEGEKEIPYQ